MKKENSKPVKEFKYDVLELIQLVKDRPCLWDKNRDSSKDKRSKRKASWEEICSALEKNYETMTGEQKRLTEASIIHKWKNLRDQFIRSLKNKRKCQYQDQLKFLVKNNPEESSSGQGETDLHEEVLLKQDDDDHDYEEGPSNCNVRKRSHSSYRDHTDNGEDNAYSAKKKKIQKNRSYGNGLESGEVDLEDGPSNCNVRDRSHNSYRDDTDDDEDNAYCEEKKNTKKDSKSGEVDPGSAIPDYVGVDEIDPRVRDEAVAFFASLLPTVVKYDEGDWLQFKIKVLKGMKKIRDKRVSLKH